MPALRVAHLERPNWPSNVTEVPNYQSLRPERRSHRLPADVYTHAGHEFHFTVCARHHGSPFSDDRLADVVVDSLMWTRERYDWILFCYCLIPDHLHLLCRLTARQAAHFDGSPRGEVPGGVLDHLRRFKSYTTSQSWRLGLEGPLWQRSSYDRVFDLQRPFEETAAYVLENPVRKGLVERWQDWPYSQIVDPWEA